MVKSRVLPVLGPGSDGSGHVVVTEPSPRRVRVFFGGVAVADSNGPRLLFETGLLPVYYFSHRGCADGPHGGDRSHDRVPSQGEGSVLVAAGGRSRGGERRLEPSEPDA